MLLGIDLGAGSVKALLLDLDGAVLGGVARACGSSPAARLVAMPTTVVGAQADLIEITRGRRQWRVGRAGVGGRVRRHRCESLRSSAGPGSTVPGVPQSPARASHHDEGHGGDGEERAVRHLQGGRDARAQELQALTAAVATTVARQSN